MPTFLGVDVGGTYTDAVLLADGTLATAKEALPEPLVPLSHTPVEALELAYQLRVERYALRRGSVETPGGGHGRPSPGS